MARLVEQTAEVRNVYPIPLTFREPSRNVNELTFLEIPRYISYASRKSSMLAGYNPASG